MPDGDEGPSCSDRHPPSRPMSPPETVQVLPPDEELLLSISPSSYQTRASSRRPPGRAPLHSISGRRSPPAGYPSRSRIAQELPELLDRSREQACPGEEPVDRPLPSGQPLPSEENSRPAPAARARSPSPSPGTTRGLVLLEGDLGEERERVGRVPVAVEPARPADLQDESPPRRPRAADPALRSP